MLAGQQARTSLSLTLFIRGQPPTSTNIQDPAPTLAWPEPLFAKEGRAETQTPD